MIICMNLSCCKQLYYYIFVIGLYIQQQIDIYKTGKYIIGCIIQLII